jgi:hypothetical protein
MLITWNNLPDGLKSVEELEFIEGELCNVLVLWIDMEG